MATRSAQILPSKQLSNFESSGTHSSVSQRPDSNDLLVIDTWDDYIILASYTLWKINIDPENHHFLEETNLPTPIYQGLC